MQYGQRRTYKYIESGLDMFEKGLFHKSGYHVYLQYDFRIKDTLFEKDGELFHINSFH